MTSNGAAISLEGRVVDKTSSAVAGATIVLMGSTLRTTSDAEGAFRLKGEAPAAVLDYGATGCLEVTAAGYEPRTILPEPAHDRNMVALLQPWLQLAGGEPVDMARWAYPYRQGSPANPPETGWLWADEEITRDGPVWGYRKSELLPRVCPRERLLCGLLWEEQRHISHLDVELPPSGQPAPDLGDLVVMFANKGSLWAHDDNPAQLYPASRVMPVLPGAIPFRRWGQPFTAQKIYVIYRGPLEGPAIPLLHAYGECRWHKPLVVEVEWGLPGARSDQPWHGRVEAYNGAIDKVEPLELGNGLVVLGVRHWQEEMAATGRRGIRLTLFPTEGPIATRTVVTLWTTGGSFSFAVPDLAQGPILVPSLGVCVAKEGTGLTGRQFQAQVAAAGRKTIRQRVRDHAEPSITSALQAIRPERRALPEFPVPPIEAPMKIDVPEKGVNAQWRLGAWHLTRWAQPVGNDAAAVSIFPALYESYYCGGQTAIGAESYQIIRTLGLIGLGKAAETGLNYWLFGEYARPFVWYGDLMGDGALCNPYNGPNHVAPGYDQKHSGGHGAVLQTAAFHGRLTADKTWLERAIPVLEKACRAVIRVRRAWMETLRPGMWCYGLIPPAITGDTNDMRLFYYTSLNWYAGLREAAQLIAESRPEVGAELLQEADLFRLDVRNASDRSAALTPVIKVTDGTFRRYISWQPYLRGMGAQLPMGGGGFYYEGTSGGIRFFPSILDRNDVLVQELLDVCEDVIFPVLRKIDVKGCEGAQVDDWFTRSGYGPQPGHECHMLAHLLTDDVPAYIRSVFNSYADGVNLDNGYTFWEGPGEAAAYDKPFEEAAFLERIRMMLLMEDDDALWLARATPRAWLEEGKTIAVSDAPTFFGTLGFIITSHVAEGFIEAEITPPARSTPREICLRLRHPAKATLCKVTVNGAPWDDFDVQGEFVRLPGNMGARVRVRVEY